MKLGGIQDGLQVDCERPEAGGPRHHRWTAARAPGKQGQTPNWCRCLCRTPQEQPPVAAPLTPRSAALPQGPANRPRRCRPAGSRPQKVRSRPRARPILHRPAHLRLGALPGDHPDRRRGGSAAAHRPVSPYHASDRPGDLQLSREPTPRSWPTPWRPRWSCRSTASRTCSTCRRSRRTTAATR